MPFFSTLFNIHVFICLADSHVFNQKICATLLYINHVCTNIYFLFSYRQTISRDFVVQELAFKSLEECLEFLEPFSLMYNDPERTIIDCKNSMALLPNI